MVLLSDVFFLHMRSSIANRVSSFISIVLNTSHVYKVILLIYTWGVLMVLK